MQRGKIVRAVLGWLIGVAVLSLAACGSGGIASSSAPRSTLPTATTSDASKVMYVAIGASDAVGVGADDPNTQAYVPILISRLPPHSGALNLGINGEKIADSLRDELPGAVRAQPTLVTVWMIGNDFIQCTPLDQYIRNLDTLLGTLQQRTHARVFVGNAPDMSQVPVVRARSAGLGACLRERSDSQIRALAEQWNSAIASVVARHSDVLVNLFQYDLAQHPEYVSRDGFHPSSAGYRVLADFFWQQIVAHHAAQAAA